MLLHQRFFRLVRVEIVSVSLVFLLFLSSAVTLSRSWYTLVHVRRLYTSGKRCSSLCMISSAPSISDTRGPGRRRLSAPEMKLLMLNR